MTTRVLEYPEVTVCEGVAGAGFEVTFEMPSLRAGFEGYVEFEFPGAVFGCAAAFAGVVLVEAFSQI